MHKIKTPSLSPPAARLETATDRLPAEFHVSPRCQHHHSRILSQGRPPVPSGTASRLRSEVCSPWPLDMLSVVSFPLQRTLTALGKTLLSAPLHQRASMAGRRKPRMPGGLPERALPFFPALQPENGAWKFKILYGRWTKVLSTQSPLWGIRNGSLRDL